MRDPRIARLLEATEAAMRQSAMAGSPAEKAIGLGFDRCRAKPGLTATRAPQRLELCSLLGPALRGAEKSGRAGVSAALAAVADDLVWGRRRSADPADVPFWNGHANAMLVGPNGIEDRDDIWLGVTLMAPHSVYTNHSHPPEEVYMSLSPGEWWNSAMDWTDPGDRGLIYNPPGILHAMRAGDATFLALWLLPL